MTALKVVVLITIFVFITNCKNRVDSALADTPSFPSPEDLESYEPIRVEGDSHRNRAYFKDAKLLSASVDVGSGEHDPSQQFKAIRALLGLDLIMTECEELSHIENAPNDIRFVTTWQSGCSTSEGRSHTKKVRFNIFRTIACRSVVDGRSEPWTDCPSLKYPSNKYKEQLQLHAKIALSFELTPTEDGRRWQKYVLEFDDPEEIKLAARRTYSRYHDQAI